MEFRFTDITDKNIEYIIHITFNISNNDIIMGLYTMTSKKLLYDSYSNLSKIIKKLKSLDISDKDRVKLEEIIFKNILNK